MHFKQALPVCLLVAVAATVAFVSPAPPHSRPPTRAVRGDAAAYRAVQSATVKIHLPDGGHGSGVCRTLSDGSVYVWTCAHVASACRIPAVHADGTVDPARFAYRPAKVSAVNFGPDERARGRSEWGAAVVRISAKSDVALMKLSPGGNRVAGSLEFATRTPRVGSAVLVCGSPKGLDATVTRGVFVFPGRKTDVGELDQIDAPAIGGNSGGPVVDGVDGKVVGLLVGGFGESFTCIVPARLIREWAARESLLFAFEGDTPPDAEPPGPDDTFLPPATP